MLRNYSALVYRQLDASQPSTHPAALIALHGTHGGLNDLMPLVETLDTELIPIFPEAARGVFRGTTVISRTWFGGTLERPESASFGDSLAQIERFVYDVRNRTGERAPRPWLLGYEQGAVLALTMGMIAPDLISGVMAIGGGLPSFNAPGLLEPVESSLPVLLIGDGSTKSENTHIDSTTETLRRLGNRLTVRWVPDAFALGPDVSDELRGWLSHHQLT